MTTARFLTIRIAFVGRSLLTCSIAMLVLSGETEAQDSETRQRSRVRNGLQVLYNFDSSTGSLVEDRSGVGKAINLRITDLKAVNRAEGTLRIRGNTKIQSDKPPKKLIDSVRRSGAISIEAWIQPANSKQDGPARIITLSKNSNERNFTLGQEGDKYQVRLRTTRTSTNGIPAVESPGKRATTKLTHVVYSHDKDGQTRIFVDGKSVVATKVGGLPSNWNGSFKLALGNELSGDRPWQGIYHLVAIYSRGLTPKEVAQNFAAGPNGTSTAAALAKVDPGQVLFETRIAPLFANHCLECHDSASKQGLLDLSKKSLAIAGGENGKAFVPGKSGDSLLWQMVESDDMPRKRDPLSASEKALLKKWIDAGATWSLDTIDPAVYAHGGQARETLVQRLTVQEYINTVRDAVGVDISIEARELLPRDVRADGFSNTAYRTST